MLIIDPEICPLSHGEVQAALVDARTKRRMFKPLCDSQFELEKKLLFFLQNSKNEENSDRMAEYIAQVGSVLSPQIQFFKKCEVYNLTHILPESIEKVLMCFPSRNDLQASTDHLEKVATITRHFFSSADDNNNEYHQLVVNSLRNKLTVSNAASTVENEKTETSRCSQPSFEYDHVEDDTVENGDEQENFDYD